MNITVTAPTVNTILAIVAVIVTALLLFAFIKRLIGLVAISLCLLLLYAGYLFFTGQRIPTSKSDIFKHGIQQIDKLKNQSGVDLKTILNSKETGR
ncbi:MAG: hypothetical protein JXA20_06220 [Spirochaetes bacterium]|nr:hypothetical protein [Spirochaetota bacterium]